MKHCAVIPLPENGFLVSSQGRIQGCTRGAQQAAALLEQDNALWERAEQLPPGQWGVGGEPRRCRRQVLEPRGGGIGIPRQVLADLSFPSGGGIFVLISPFGTVMVKQGVEMSLNCDANNIRIHCN